MTDCKAIDWCKPLSTISDKDIAFGANALDFMPTMQEIPDEFKRFNGTSWNKFQVEWFFNGLKSVSFNSKEGVDGAAAFRQLRAIQGSFAPKHEHKEAAIAYLCSLWFDKIKANGKTYK
jgi:hypothetical protein